MCEVPEGLTPSLLDLIVYRNITVKFQLNKFQTVAQVYDNTLDIGIVKTDIATKFQIDPKYVDICKDAKVVADNFKLYELCHNDFGILELDLELSAEARQFNEVVEQRSRALVLDADVYYRHFQLPDFMTVHIPVSGSGDGAARQLIVQITNQPILKPFLGGYINNRSGKVLFFYYLLNLTLI